MKKPSWKPVRRGSIYCSTACGANCIHTDYIKAKLAAGACLKRMKTKGWKIVLNENMGWFWKLQDKSGNLTVSGGQIPYRDNPEDGFHAMLSDSKSGGCSSSWYDEKRFSDPNKAVSHRIAIATNHVAKLNKVLAALPKEAAK